MLNKVLLCTNDCSKLGQVGCPFVNKFNCNIICSNSEEEIDNILEFHMGQKVSVYKCDSIEASIISEGHNAVV